LSIVPDIAAADRDILNTLRLSAKPSEAVCYTEPMSLATDLQAPDARPYFLFAGLRDLLEVVTI
jgi:hypothetical protein